MEKRKILVKEMEGRWGYYEIKEGGGLVINSFFFVIILKYVRLKDEQNVIDLKQEIIKVRKYGNMRNDFELNVFKMVFRVFFGLYKLF